MSRHPSPGPSHPASQNSHQPPSAPSARRQRPTHTIGIAAGAEDVKYQAKYKDLKRKVKEIEVDNDKLHFKILQAKRSIQRMKLERAILYERLATASSLDVHDRHPLNQVPSGPSLPSSRSYSASHQNRDIRDRPLPMDPDPAPVDYLRSHPNPRAPAQDPPARPPVPAMDPPLGPGPAPSPRMTGPGLGGPDPSPRMTSVHSPRRDSATHDPLHHLPPLPHLPPVGQYEGPGARSHSLPHSHAASPPLHHAHPNSSSHERGRSQSSRSHQPPPQPYPGHMQQYPEHLPPVQRVLHSPPPHADRDRPPRRHEGNDYPPTHNDPHLQHTRHSSQVSPHLHHAETRTPGRVHAHQRLGPGSYINREESLPRQYETERERGRERDSRGDYERDHRPRDSSRGRDINSVIHSPHASHRRPLPPPLPQDYSELPPSHHTHPHPHPHQNLPPRIRDESYYHEGNHQYHSLHTSRSDTPGSGSGSGAGPGEGPSRPDSRTQFYEQQDRNRPLYRLRPVNQSTNNEDMEFVGHEDVRSQSRDPTNAPPRPSSPAADNPPGSGGNNGGNASGGGGNNYPPAPPAPSTGSGIPEQAQQQGRLEQSRKRSRNEMEVDSEDDVGNDRGGNNSGPGFSGASGGGKLQGEDRDRDRDRGSSKRYHREHVHRRSVDNHESAAPPPAGSAPQDQERVRDSRMAPS